MNPLSYGSLEAGQRLAAKGIVFAPVRGSAIYCESFKSYGFINYGPLTASAPGAFEVTLDFDPCQFRYLYPHEFIVLPSMAEVWRELPEEYIYIEKIGGQSYAWICNEEKDPAIESPFIDNINPTDALIDLLIWVRANPGKSFGEKLGRRSESERDYDNDID